MTTIGWFIALVGFLVGRAATKGRGVSDVPGDLGDLIVAAVQGDYAAVQEVLNRTGETNAATAVEGSNYGGEPGANNVRSESGAGVLAEAKRIGTGKPYVWGATGPNSFDCSGLVWRAMLNVTGKPSARFTSSSWPSVAPTVGATQVTDPTVGDIVLWPGHIGIVDGNGTAFSAMSPKSGIGTAKIDDLSKSSGGSPRYWRLPGATGGGSASPMNERAV